MSPQPITGPEDLTPYQRQYLRALRAYCDSPPTLGAIYARTLPNLLFTVLIGAIGIAGGVLLESPALACIFGGMMVGVLLRDLGWFLRSLRTWPATEAIIDRERLDNLLGEPPDDNYS